MGSFDDSRVIVIVTALRSSVIFDNLTDLVFEAAPLNFRRFFTQQSIIDSYFSSQPLSFPKFSPLLPQSTEIMKITILSNRTLFLALNFGFWISFFSNIRGSF
jgi:hypothetical protein